MSKVYDAAIVDGFLKQASDAMHGVMHVAEGVMEENATLKRELAIAKEAAANKVELDKVAAAKAASLDAGKVATFIDTLIAHGSVPASARAEFIDKCAADGNVVVDVATTALRLSETPATQGHGIKSANAAQAKSDGVLSQQEIDDIWTTRMGW